MQQLPIPPAPPAAPAIAGSQVRVVGVNPSPSAVYEAFVNQRRELRDQLETLQDSRRELSRQLKEPMVTGVDRAGLEQHIAELDARITSLDQQIAAADAQVAKSAAVPGAVVPPRREIHQGPPDEVLCPRRDLHVRRPHATQHRVRSPVVATWRRRGEHDSARADGSPHSSRSGSRFDRRRGGTHRRRTALRHSRARRSFAGSPRHSAAGLTSRWARTAARGSASRDFRHGDVAGVVVGDGRRRRRRRRVGVAIGVAGGGTNDAGACC